MPKRSRGVRVTSGKMMFPYKNCSYDNSFHLASKGKKPKTDISEFKFILSESGDELIIRKKKDIYTGPIRTEREVTTEISDTKLLKPSSSQKGKKVTTAPYIAHGQPVKHLKKKNDTDNSVRQKRAILTSNQLSFEELRELEDLPVIIGPINIAKKVFCVKTRLCVISKKGSKFNVVYAKAINRFLMIESEYEAWGKSLFPNSIDLESAVKLENKSLPPEYYEIKKPEIENKQTVSTELPKSEEPAFSHPSIKEKVPAKRSFVGYKWIWLPCDDVISDTRKELIHIKWGSFDVGVTCEISENQKTIFIPDSYLPLKSSLEDYLRKEGAIGTN